MHLKLKLVTLDLRAGAAQSSEGKMIPLWTTVGKKCAWKTDGAHGTPMVLINPAL